MALVIHKTNPNEKKHNVKESTKKDVAEYPKGSKSRGFQRSERDSGKEYHFEYVDAISYSFSDSHTVCWSSPFDCLMIESSARKWLFCSSSRLILCLSAFWANGQWQGQMRR